MTISEFNMVATLVIQKVNDSGDLEGSFEEVKDLVFPRKNKE